jgi:hypothetical protein
MHIPMFQAGSTTVCDTCQGVAHDKRFYAACMHQAYLHFSRYENLDQKAHSHTHTKISAFVCPIISDFDDDMFIHLGNSQVLIRNHIVISSSRGRVHSSKPHRPPLSKTCLVVLTSQSKTLNHSR